MARTMSAALIIFVKSELPLTNPTWKTGVRSSLGRDFLARIAYCVAIKALAMPVAATICFAADMVG